MKRACVIGGGFGGKISVYLEPVAAILSRKCGRPEDQVSAFIAAKVAMIPIEP